MGKQYNSKGSVEFEVSQELNNNVYYNLVYIDNPSKVDLENCDIMSGSEFLRCVKGCMITDYDGWVDNVFIDKHSSNIRLADYGIGDYDDRYINFIEDEWIDLCKNNKVEVLWVNK